MLAIVITDSSGFTHVHPLVAEDGRSYSLGRAENCDFSLPNEQTLSDVHCFLSVVDGTYVYLQDNGSTNGIFVESQPFSADYMAFEREYILGSCKLMLIYTADDAAQPAAAPVRKRSKLKPKAVAAPAAEPQPAVAPVAEPQTVAPMPPAEPVRKRAKLKAKSVAPAPVYEEPAPVYAEPAPVYVESSPVYEEPAPAPTPEPAPASAPVPAPEPVVEPVAEPTPEPTPEPAPQKSEKTVTAKKSKNAKVKVRSKAGRSAARAHYEPEAPRVAALVGLPQAFGLKLRLINDKNQLTVGTPLRFGLTAETNCYVYLLQYDSEGQACMLVPGNEEIAHKLFKDVETQFPSIGCKDYELMVEAPTGQETIIALACAEEGNFASVWQGLVDAANGSPELGVTELQAIGTCKTSQAAWASYVLNITTKP